MLDKTIDSTLQNLRRDLIRNGGDGLKHVEALMRLRGIPMPRVMPKQSPDRAGHGVMKVMILEALRGGPQTFRDLVAYVSGRRPEIGPDAAYKRTAQVLANMKARGLVGRDGKVWNIVK